MPQSEFCKYFWKKLWQKFFKFLKLRIIFIRLAAIRNSTASDHFSKSFHGFFSVDRDNFGALVDIGNFACADEACDKAVGIMAQYARHAHAKDFYLKEGWKDDPGEGWFKSRSENYLKGAIIGHGDVPIKQCLRILKKNGYDGILAIEFEGKEDPLFGVRVGIANLHRFLKEIYQ